MKAIVLFKGSGRYERRCGKMRIMDTGRPRDLEPFLSLYFHFVLALLKLYIQKSITMYAGAMETLHGSRNI